MPVCNRCASSRTNARKDDTMWLRQPFKQMIRPKEKWIYFRCEPLVEEAIWEHCQKRLAESLARYSGNPKRTYLLSGILRCPFCGRGMSGTYDKSRHQMRYHCREAVKSRQHTTKAQCDPRTYNGVHAEKSVVWTLQEIVHKPALMEEAFRVWCGEAGLQWLTEGRSRPLTEKPPRTRG